MLGGFEAKTLIFSGYMVNETNPKKTDPVYIVAMTHSFIFCNSLSWRTSTNTFDS